MRLVSQTQPESAALLQKGYAVKRSSEMQKAEEQLAKQVRGMVVKGELQ